MEPLSKRLNLPLGIENGFHEKKMSHQPVADIKAARLRMWEEFDFRLPGGESNREAQQRAMEAMGRLRRAHPDAAVVVGCHGTLIALILNAIDPSFGYEEWRAMPMPDIFRIDFSANGKPVIDHVKCPGIEGFTIPG